MPIYEYMCRKCNRAFEHLVRSKTESLPPCPKCGGKKIEKQFSSFSARVATGSAPCESLGSCPAGGCPSAGGCGPGSCPL